MDLSFTYLISSDQNYSLKYMSSKTAVKGKKEVGERGRVEILSNK